MTDIATPAREALSDDAGRIKVFDGDNHYYETYDSFTRYMEPKFRHKAINVRKNERGRNIVMVGDEPLKSNPAHPQDFVGLPGSLIDSYARTDLNTSQADLVIQNKMRAEDDPSFIDVDARLRFMDKEGIDAAMLYPSLGVMVEEQLTNDVEATYANIRAFNLWLDEDWGFNTQDRIFGVPMLSLLDLDMCLDELDRVMAAGARAVHLRGGPVEGRSMADPYFDPFWARLNEARIPVALHSSFSQYHRLWSVHWGELGNPSYRELTPFQSYLGMGSRPMMDSLASLVFHGLFTRFENVNCLAVEGGHFWMKHLLKVMDKAQLHAGNNKLSLDLGDRPSNVLKRHVFVTPFPEEDPIELTEIFPVSNIILGSDYPHPEGLAHPATYAEKLAPLGDAATRAIMGGNLARVMGIWN